MSAHDETPPTGTEPEPLTAQPEGIETEPELVAEGPEPAAEAVEPATEAPEPAAGEGKSHLARQIWTVAVSALIFILLVGLALPVFSTLQPEYYERYPALHVRMDNWRKSTHAKVGCAGCHVKPGFLGFMEFAARSVPDFYSQLIYGPSKTNLFSTPDASACRKCHTDYRQVSPQGDLLIPHRAHVVVLKMQCAECHKNLVHSVNAQGFNSPEMATCLRCHDGKTATNRCEKCHTGKQAPPSHAAANWLQVHSQKVGTVDCGKCHGFTQNFCADCHSRKPKSHAGNWKTAHAVAAKEHRQACVVCHDAKFCKNCHD